MDRLKVVVYSAREHSQRTRLLQGLSELYPVAFSPAVTLERLRGDAALLLGVSRADAARVALSGFH